MATTAKSALKEKPLPQALEDLIDSSIDAMSEAELRKFSRSAEKIMKNSRRGASTAHAPRKRA